MKTKNIAFCVNNAYVNHLVVTIYSLLTHNDTASIHIHVLSSDITTESKNVITLLVQQHKNAKVTFHVIDPADFEGVSMTMNYITRETFYRLMLADILPESVDRVLYLDADILVRGRIDELFDLTIDDYYAAGVPDIYLDRDGAHKTAIGMQLQTYINAGVLLLNLKKMRQENISRELVVNANSKSYKYQDQDVINIAFKNKVLVVDRKFNSQIKDKQYKTLPEEEQVILHYSGGYKPWNRDRLYDAYSTLYDDYKLRAAKYINERNQNIKYGLLKYSTDNVGDSVQGIAARRFLPTVDYYFERDNMDATKTLPGETVKVIINGWWGDGPENWPPLDQHLDILPISMYVEDRIQEEFKKPRSRALLNFFGPIGARSYGTKKFLEENDVSSYFSGCLTLTLNADKSIKKQDFVLAVDVPDEVYEKMCSQTTRKVVRIGVLRQLTTDVKEQYRLAEFYLYLYQSAHAVVTTRLHSMLPSLALGTPVLFINDILDDDDVRFSGLAELAHNLRSEEYVANPSKFDINNPPKNKSDYLKVRRDLEKRCKKFTGYMSEEGFLTQPVSEMVFDADFIQSAVGGASELGDLREQTDKLQDALRHKENHVLELAEELKRINAKYTKVTSSLPWKIIQVLKRPSLLMDRIKR